MATNTYVYNSQKCLLVITVFVFAEQLWQAALFSLIVVPVFAQTWVSDLVVIPVENDPIMGTSPYHLAKLNASGHAATIAPTDQTGIIGIVQQEAGKTGKAGIAQIGIALCDFDGGTQSGDYVQASTTTAGLCHDAGPQFPASGAIVGRAMSTNAGPGLFEACRKPNGGSRRRL
jgi:hypothetical protein